VDSKERKDIMRDLENDIIAKLEVVELKKEVLSIVHSLHFDRCYDIEECIMDLHKLLVTLDYMEMPQDIMMKLNQSSLTRKGITELLEDKVLKSII